MKRILCGIMVAVMVCFGGVFPIAEMQVSAATTVNFTFKNGTMSKEVLCNYLSRAVTASQFCAGLYENIVFYEDLRSLQRMGAKFIGRAAFYSWDANLTTEQIENHYTNAEKAAKKAHQADPEMILQAGVFECAYRDTINNTKIPAYVFEAFGLPVQNRNFVFENVVYPKGHQYGIGFWGHPDSGMPDITKTEAKMYFYYLITRYIDCGFEAFHLGQVYPMMGGTPANATHWKTLLDKARAYAKQHARRGLALFDAHVDWHSTGLKVGNDLLLDLNGAPLYPLETEIKDGVKCATIAGNNTYPVSYIGRMEGGNHPLGFGNVETNFTILEFDNWGLMDAAGNSNGKEYGTWGYDDITWFATQPEWYRNQFLKECHAWLSTNYLDSRGKQQYFLQMPFNRVLTLGPNKGPIATLKIEDVANVGFLFDFIAAEGINYQKEQGESFYTLEVRWTYRANRQSGGCPVGFNQEDTIRELFLGKNVKEDAALLQIVLPPGYDNKFAPEDSSSQGTTGGNTTSGTTKPGGNTTGSTTKPGSNTTGGTTKPGGNTTGGIAKPGSNTTGGTTQPGGSITTGNGVGDGTTAINSSTTSKKTSSKKKKNKNKNKNQNNKFPWLWVIFGGVGGVLLLGGGTLLLIFFLKKKKGDGEDLEAEMQSDDLLPDDLSEQSKIEGIE